MGIKLFTLSIPYKRSETFISLSSVLSKFHRFASSVANQFKLFVRTFIERMRQTRIKRQETAGIEGLPKRRFNFPFKRPSLPIKPILLLIGVLALFFVGVKLLAKSGQGSVSGETITVSDAKASTDIGKEFSFPLKNSKGEEISSIKYLVEKAELRDEIIIQGKRATAVKGRIFLILNLKVSNEFTQSIEINTKDYVRLSVNGNEEEWLAPDIHNDPVEVQAISTKYTKVGFAINDNDRNLMIQVGEIKGKKESININF